MYARAWSFTAALWLALCAAELGAEVIPHARGAAGDLSIGTGREGLLPEGTDRSWALGRGLSVCHPNRDRR